MKHDVFRSFFFIVLLTFSALAWAGGSVDVAQENKSSSVVLTSYLQIFEDPTRSLTLNDVQRAEIDAQFKTSGRLEKSINFSYSKSAYWLRLTLENSSDVAVNRVIEINYPLIEHLDFYWLRHAQQTQSVQTGYAMPFENRAYKSRIFAFPLAIAAHSQSVIYFRALSPNAIILPVNLWESRAFEQKERNEYAFQALYFGVLIAILLFCLALTLIVKEFDYVLCVSMTLFIALTLTAYRGLGAEFLWPHFPQLTQVGALFFGSLTLATKLAFMRRMLSMKWTMPRLDSLTQVFIGLYLLIPALLLCCFDIAKFVVILFAFSAVLVLCVSVMGILQKQRNAYFICASFSLLAIGVLVNTSLVVALIPTNFFTVNSLQIGSAFELLVFTLLLTDRYRVIYQAKQQSEEILDDVSHKLVTEKEERREIELLKQTYFEHHFAIDQAAIFAETDDKGIITFVNKHFCRISGYSEAELIGSTHNLLKSGFHPPEFYSHLWKAIQSGRVWRDDICNRHKNGSLYWSNTVIVPILDFERRQGYPKKYITICFDVTDRKEAQQRQAMLTNQVNQMQKIESISRLTAGIAHDFNNILSGIIGYNQLNQFACEECQDPKLKEEIAFNTNQVEIASYRAVNVIKKMMAYSRQNPEHKEAQEIKPTREVIEEVLTMVRPGLTSLFQIELNIESDVDIQIDSIDLHQILTNLLVNARDAMKERGGVIVLSLKKVTTHEFICTACAQMLEGHFIELRVLDSGTGIAENVIDHIFDPFFTTKKVGEGTGLGLSTVSGMVHDAAGHIIVESKTTPPNQGTAFRLLFAL